MNPENLIATLASSAKAPWTTPENLEALRGHQTKYEKLCAAQNSVSHKAASLQAKAQIAQLATDAHANPESLLTAVLETREKVVIEFEQKRRAVKTALAQCTADALPQRREILDAFCNHAEKVALGVAAEEAKIYARFAVAYNPAESALVKLIRAAATSAQQRIPARGTATNWRQAPAQMLAGIIDL